MVISKLESNKYVFHNTSAPGNFLMVRLFTQMLDISAILMMCLFAVIVGKAMRRADNRNSRVKQNTLKLLLGNIISTAISCLSPLSMTMFEKVDPKFCSYNARLGGCLYAMPNFFLYCLLMKRAEAVGSNSFGAFNKSVFASVVFLVKIGTAMMPFFAVASIFVFEGNLYFSEEFCVQHVDPMISFLAMCLDTGLSVGYLLLFLLPVLYHVHTIPKDTVHLISRTGNGNESVQNGQRELTRNAAVGPTAKIKTTAKQNLQISSVAIASTVIYGGGISLAFQFTTGEDMALVPYLHWVQWGVYAAAIDLCINCICVMLMFKRLWITTGKSVGAKRENVAETTDLKGDCPVEGNKSEGGLFDEIESEV